MTGNDWRLFVLVLLAFVGAAFLTPLARKLALHRGITDNPATNKLHENPTPYLGGVAIAVCVLAGSSLLPHWQSEALVILAAALLVGCVGLIDDVRTLGPLPRVAVEVVAATIVFSAGAQAQVGNEFVDWALTVTWLVVLTNAFNLLDNMDGCAGILATVTASALAVAALLQGQVLVGGLAVVVAGTCVGFLVHNWHPVRPARIFMGDAGSLFLGFLLSTIALKLRFPGSRFSGIVAVILLAAPALFDTTLVVISRLRAGRQVLLGGTDHTSHRLRTIGVPQPVVPIVLAVATVGCCALGILVGREIVPPEAVLAVLIPISLVLLWAFLHVPAYTPSPAPDGDTVPHLVRGPGPVPVMSGEMQ